MIIYRLEHMYDTDKYQSTEVKSLGYYSSTENVHKAIAYYRTIEGFRDFPSGYVITEVKIECARIPVYIYELSHYIHDTNYDYEYSNIIGVFSSKKKSLEAKSSFKKLNYVEFSKFSLENEIFISCNRVDEYKNLWYEGFIVITEDKR